jgi:ABC-type multidrug transport system, ATPase component
MKVILDDVAKGPRNAALPPTSLRFETGQAVLARAETEQRPSVLGLIASGRMRPDQGSVTIDDTVDYGAMRRRIALIDAPAVCDPVPDVTVAGIVAEELMFAGRPWHLIAVRRTLQDLGLSEYARWSIGTVPPSARIRLLTELALLRDGVSGIVITSPDRHGGDPSDWWRIAREIAARGYAVLVIAGDASAAAIGASGIVQRLTAEQAVAAIDDDASVHSTDIRFGTDDVITDDVDPSTTSTESDDA